MINKLVGDLNVVDSGSQLIEQGNKAIVEHDYSSYIYEIQQTSDMDNIYFCDFTRRYPYYTGHSTDTLIVQHDVETNLFDNFTIRSFDPTEDGELMDPGDTKTSYISKFLPWLVVLDSNGNVTHDYKIRIYANDTNDGGDLIPGYDGFVSSYTTAWDIPNILVANKIRHKLTITPTAGDITVKTFGLMYNKEIYIP